MHIIVLEDEPSSLRGGQELNLLEICRSLSQRGHSINLLYTKAGNLLQQYQEFCSQTTNVNGYDLDRRRIAHIFNFFADIWRISVNKNSVIFSNRYYDVFFGSVLSLSKNIPLVCYLQLPPPAEDMSRPHKLGLKGVEKFITVSTQTKLDWVKSGFNGEKINVVHNGTDPKVFKPIKEFSLVRKEENIPENTRVISYIGRLDREKGVETLIKGFALLLNSYNNARLLIAGKPLSTKEAYKKYLEQLVIDLGIEKSVSFLGYLTNTASLYQASDVTVLPSLWSEPFGRTVIESMACSVPVVASRTGGIPEILTDEFQTGLFEPGNEQDLSKTLSQIIDWKDQNPLLGERCRAHILSKFTIDKMVDGIEKVLLSVVKK